MVEGRDKDIINQGGEKEIVAELPVTKMGKLDKKALRDWLGGDTLAGRSTP